MSKKDQKRSNSKANCPKHSFASTETDCFHQFPALTAVPLIGLVITVKVTITPPASINAQATVAHELSRATRLVRCCRDDKTQKEQTQTSVTIPTAPQYHPYPPVLRNLALSRFLLGAVVILVSRSALTTQTSSLFSLSRVKQNP